MKIINLNIKEKIVKKLASDDVEEQEKGKIMADNILEGNNKGEIDEDNDKLMRIKANRTVINKYTTDEDMNPNTMSKGNEFSSENNKNYK